MLPGSISPSRWCSRCSILCIGRGSKAITDNSGPFAGVRPVSHSTRRGSGLTGNWKSRWDIGINQQCFFCDKAKLATSPWVFNWRFYPFPVRKYWGDLNDIDILQRWRANTPAPAFCRLPESRARRRKRHNSDSADFAATSQNNVSRISDISLQLRLLNSTKTDFFCFAANSMSPLILLTVTLSFYPL